MEEELIVLSDQTLAYAEAITRAFLGVDALYRADPCGDDVGLIVSNMAGAEFEPERFTTHEEALGRFSELIPVSHLGMVPYFIAFPRSIGRAEKAGL